MASTTTSSSSIDLTPSFSRKANMYLALKRHFFLDPDIWLSRLCSTIVSCKVDPSTSLWWMSMSSASPKWRSAASLTCSSVSRRERRRRGYFFTLGLALGKGDMTVARSFFLGAMAAHAWRR